MADLRWISTVAYARTRVNFSLVNKTDPEYERSRVKIKVEPRSNFTFTRGISCIASISFTHGKITR